MKPNSYLERLENKWPKTVEAVGMFLCGAVVLHPFILLFIFVYLVESTDTAINRKKLNLEMQTKFEAEHRCLEEKFINGKTVCTRYQAREVK